MISTAALEAMAAAGCSAEQLVAVIKAENAAKEAAAAVRREKDRERKRAMRAAEKLKSEVVHDCPQMSTLSARTDADIADSSGQSGQTVSLSPVPLLSPTPPNNPLTPNPIQKINKRAGSAAHRLPDDWKMNGPDLAYALGKGLSEQEAVDLFERFCTWAWSAGGPNAKKINWHQAWQGWVQREGPGIIAKRTAPFGKPLTAHQQKQQQSKDILDDLEHLATRSPSSNEAHFGLLRYDPGDGSEGFRGGPSGYLDDLSEAGSRSRN